MGVDKTCSWRIHHSLKEEPLNLQFSPWINTILESLQHFTQVIQDKGKIKLHSWFGVEFVLKICMKFTWGISSVINGTKCVTQLGNIANGCKLLPQIPVQCRNFNSFWFGGRDSCQLVKQFVRHLVWMHFDVLRQSRGIPVFLCTLWLG